MSTIVSGLLLDAGDIKVIKAGVDPAPVLNKPYGRER